MKLTMKKLSLAALCAAALFSNKTVANNEMHSRVHEILITCFLETDQEGHLSAFIDAVCGIIEKHRLYFEEQYPEVKIDNLLVDLHSIKNETNVLVIAKKLEAYWDLLPDRVKELSMVKLAVNVRKRVRGPKNKKPAILTQSVSDEISLAISTPSEAEPDA